MGDWATQAMGVTFERLFHPRILSHCRQLYLDGHYPSAVREAMIQVELALKEKSGVKNKYGYRLLVELLGKGKGIKLRVPFGDEYQEKAEKLFQGAFAYYRNYAAHNTACITALVCLRVMVIASELLDLIGASELSFADVGGISGLVERGIFRDAGEVAALLNLLDGYHVPGDAIDGLMNDLLAKGFTVSQMQAVIEIGLVEYTSEQCAVPIELLDLDDMLPDTVGWFRLTKLGTEIASGSDEQGASS